MLPKKRNSLELNKTKQRAEINPLIPGFYAKVKQT